MFEFPANMTEEQITDELVDWSRYKLIVELIPEPYRALAGLAQLWGTVEEGRAGKLLQRAPDHVLRELNEKVRPYCAMLNDWLAAPDAHPAENWREYSSYSNLRLAADMAVIELQHRTKRSQS